jgi:virulence-associated protein VagC
MIAIQQIAKIDPSRRVLRFEKPLPDTVSAGLAEVTLSVRPLPAECQAGKRWETFLHGLAGFSDDFMAEGRDQGVQPEREGL